MILSLIAYDKMLVYEAKLKGKQNQYDRLNEAIRTGLFVRNSCLRLWVDGLAKSRNDLYKYCKELAANPDFPWAKKLNSMARQAHAERAWAAVARFFAKKGGYPNFKKNRRFHGSVEYKTTGYKLSEDRQKITFTDGFKAGTFKLFGTRDLNYYQLNQIKRVRVVRRADGWYCQFLIDAERNIELKPANQNIGIDVGLNYFYTDNQGNKAENPRFLRSSKTQLKRLHKSVSRKKKGSNNRTKAIEKLARKHLQVSRQRKDWAVKLARCVVMSNDVVAIEDLKIKNMVKNHHLSKSISDASWRLFREWLEYFGKVFGKVVVAVPPHYTSINCSGCGAKVQKSLSTRTHTCICGTTLCRDRNAAKNILAKGLNAVGRTVSACGEDVSLLTSVGSNLQ